MAYQALARQWRPQTFSDLIGQEHVTKAIVNSLTLNRLHHAYLFTGTRGVGKTSIARLFAKSLNCIKGISAVPCRECEACVAIEKGQFVDLLEIDAASKTGVEDTGQLLDNVQYLPSTGRFKVYLIDEVHMLSTSSFNALLKTLEEPPSHVKFILATTDPQKLPPTVLSRCLQFHLRTINTALMVEHLNSILSAEHCTHEPDAVELLAHAARGSLRDALSLLDQAIALDEKGLRTDTVKEMLGYTKRDYALLLLEALAAREAAKILDYCAQVEQEGGQFMHAIRGIQTYLHQMMLVQHLGQDMVSFAYEESLLPLAQYFDAKKVQLYYQIALKGASDMLLAPTLRIGFEVVMLRMLSFTLLPETGEAPTKVPSFESVKEPEAKNKVVPVKTEEVGEVPDTLSTPHEPKLQWCDIVKKLKLSGLAQTALEHAVLKEKQPGGLVLSVDSGHQSLFTETVQKRIAEALSSYYNDKVKIILVTERANFEDTPAGLRQQHQEQIKQDATWDLKNDKHFQALQAELGAKLVDGSVKEPNR